MKNKPPIWDVRDAIAVVFAAIAITTVLVVPTAAPVASIANPLAIALVLCVRRYVPRIGRYSAEKPWAPMSKC